MIFLLLIPPIAAAGVFLAIRLYRSWALGAELVLLAYIGAAIAVEPLSFMAAGFNIFVEDLVGGMLIVVTLLRLALRPSVRRQVLGWMPFVAATAGAFAVGIALHGIKAAGVEYRMLFYLCAAVLYCASFPLDSQQMKRLVRIWLAGAVVLMGVAWFRWSAGLLGLGIAEQWAMVGGGNNPLRVLNAGQSFFLAQAFLMTLYLRRHARTGGMLLPLAVMLAVTVLLLQHRSVWVATLLAWALMAWHERVLWRFVRTATVVAAIVLVGYWLMPDRISRNNQVAESLESSVAEPFDMEKSTLVWRVVMWNEYLLEYAMLPPWQMLAGTGLGNPGIYRVGEADVEHAAHSYFVFMLNRAGLIGLLALLFSYGMLLRRLGGTGGRWDYLGMLLTLIASQLIYLTVYGPSSDQGLLVGAAFGVVSGRRIQRAG